MSTHRRLRVSLATAWLAVTLSLLCGPVAFAASSDDASSLRAKYSELRADLGNNSFHQPIHIDSAQAGDNLRGDVYAVLPHPFGKFASAMKDPDDWCQVLILPFNTKYCHATQAAGGANLQVRIGRKADQPANEAYRIDFALQPVAAGANYFESRLSAASGPLGTRDYRIVVSAVPLDSGRTFMHLSYSYGYGSAGRFAMNMYLSTVGANKVGFSVAGRDENGQPVYIGGVRGAIERNVMRYYLAIQAHLASLAAPAAERNDRRMQAWIDSAERYPRQLHEMDRAAYISMKRGETERQQALLQE